MDVKINNKMKKYITLENRIRDVIRKSRKGLYERKFMEKDQGDQIAAGTYVTKHFEMCPGAQKLFASLPSEVNPDDAEKLAILHDKLFAMEKHAVAQERTTDDEVEEAGQLADRIRMMADKMGISSRVKYIDDHLKIFNKYKEKDQNVFDKVDDKVMRRLLTPTITQTPEPKDSDIDNKNFRLSRNLKAQRKLKIIDAD